MIKINDRFYINANSNCYTLQEKTKVENTDSKNYGEIVFRDLGYYTTIESCLNGLLKVTTREFINKETENSIKDLLQFIENQYQYLKNLKLDI